MSKRLVLVDFENVQKLYLSILDEIYRAIVFVGASQAPPKAARNKATAHRFSRVDFQKIEGNGKTRKIEVVERAIFPNELSTFSECFITGSAAELTPVCEIGEHRYKPGAISEALVNDYSALCNGKLELAL